MGANGFMGRTLLALQVLFRDGYFIEAFGDSASKKHQTVSRFCGNKLTASPVLDTQQMSTTKEHRYITNAHLKIIRYRT